MINKIKVSKDIVNYIEGLSYEVNARKDIISFMLSNNMDTSSEAFSHYHKEYEEFTVKLNTAKSYMESMYITNNYDGKSIPWHLDFETCVLILGNKESDE